MNPRPTLAVLVACTALFAAGCGGQDAPPAIEDAPPAIDDAPPAVEKASPSPSTPGPLSAADGTDLKACRDGVCEVIVEDGDSLPTASGLGAVKVLIESDELTLTRKGADGFSSTLTGGAGNVQQMNEQVFVIVAVQDGKAVLRMMKA